MALNRRFWIENRAVQNRAIPRSRKTLIGCDSDGDSILFYCDLTFFAFLCGISGDSRPAILGIVRFAIGDSVPLSSTLVSRERPKILTNRGFASSLSPLRHMTSERARKWPNLSLKSPFWNPFTLDRVSFSTPKISELKHFLGIRSSWGTRNWWG